MSSIYRVAEIAGVSPKTAARILAGESKRSKSRERVLAVAKQIGYVRNQQAATLRQGASAVIGIVVPNVTNPFYGKFVQTMHDAFLERGFSIFLTSSFGNPNEEIRALKTLQTYRVAGVILNAAERPVNEEVETLCRQFIDQGKPLLLSGEVNMELEGAHRIVIQNEEAVSKAMRYLMSKGHRRIAFVGGPMVSRAMQQRHQAYQAALEEAGIQSPDSYTIHTSGTLSDVVTKVTDCLVRFPEPKRPTAFIAGNDVIAISAIKAFSKLSLRVPEDIAIVGFDGIDLGEVLTPPLTTLRQPQEKIASDVAELLVSHIRKESDKCAQTLYFGAELIIRGSA